MTIDEAAKRKLCAFFTTAYASRDRTFGNGRMVQDETASPLLIVAEDIPAA
jgi:hypothetical protein